MQKYDVSDIPDYEKIMHGTGRETHLIAKQFIKI